MKAKHIVLFTLMFIPLLLQAEGPRNGSGNGPGGGMGNGPGAGLATLHQFLAMEDAELEQLEATIRRIRQMTPEERKAYSDRIAQYQRMPVSERQSLHQAWGKLDATVRAAWRNYMLNLSPEDSDLVRTQLQEIPFESRTKWRIDILRKEGLLPEEVLPKD